MISEEVEREGYRPSVHASFYNKEKRIELENQNNTREPDTKANAQANPEQAYSEADPEAYSEADAQVGEQDEDHLEQEESDEAEPRSDLSINHHPLLKSD